MSKFFTYLCASLCAYSASALHADAPMESMPEAMPEFRSIEIVQMPIEEVRPGLHRASHRRAPGRTQVGN